MEPSLAWVPYETQIASALASAEAPLSSKDILKILQTRFKMTKVRNEQVNTVLYNLSVYEIVNQPAVDQGLEPAPLWQLRPAAAATARKNLGLPPISRPAPSPGGAAARPAHPPAPLSGGDARESRGDRDSCQATVAAVVPNARDRGLAVAAPAIAADASAVYGDLPPVEVVPDDEYAGLTAALGGPARDPKVVWSAMESLRAKGVSTLTVLVDQPAGNAVWSGDWDSWPKFDRPPTSCAYPGGRLPLRLRIAGTHREALAKSDLLCVVSDKETIADYPVRHVIALFEEAGRPVHRQPGTAQE